MFRVSVKGQSYALDHFPRAAGRLVFESMAARPEALYGADLKSNYQSQALKLSKHFKG
ncbi:2'-deoxycytidine 5'-triphosphate deaminase domain-containing protein [Bosea sp. Root670]|uniref:2'-deoxycytidine 5'-triphosphate deaminase domain-containing protein n=1 Tax=Bosea sp. Root670 TaxID=1736583 RepID=UPI0009EB5E80